MTCDIARNKLLAVADPHRPAADVAAHIAGCAACRQYRVRLDVLTDDLLALPAPESAAKFAFVQSLTAAGPVITTKPALPNRDGLGFARLFRRGSLAPAGGIAAAVAVGSLLYLTSGAKTVLPEPQSPRHELLAKLVKLDAELALADTPEKRLPKLADMADALQSEAKDVQLAAQKPGDLRVLSDSFEKVVKDGIVKQAAALPRFTPAAERAAALNAAAARLATVAAEADAAGSVAPPQTKASFMVMAEVARSGRQDVLNLLKGA